MDHFLTRAFCLNFYNPFNGLLINLSLWGNAILMVWKLEHTSISSVVTTLWGKTFQFSPSLEICLLLLSAKYWGLLGLSSLCTNRKDGDVQS